MPHEDNDVMQNAYICAMCMQTSSEVFFRKVNFWDKGGRDAPPVFNVDGVSYLYVKVPLSLPSRLSEGCWQKARESMCMYHASACLGGITCCPLRLLA